MKKSLLLIAGAMLGTMAVAQVTEPTIYPGMVISGISPDGTWAASSDETTYNFNILNLATGETYGYGSAYGTEHMLSTGLGKFVSNNGIVLAASYADDMPYYWEGGEWHQLPILDTDMGGAPNAVTADGSIIVGHVSKMALTTEDVGTMAVPVVWSRNANGGYDMYTELAHPAKDWTGRTPQYILLDDVSADGSVIAGDVVDYSGFNNEPIIYTKDADGKWTYTLVHPELINPGKVEFPAYPGDAPNPPEATDFMTADELEAYNEALDNYYNRPYPYIYDYMTDEEVDAYNDAFEAYLEDDSNPYPEVLDYISAEGLAAYEKAYNDYFSVQYPETSDYMTDEELDAYNAAYSQYEQDFEVWAEKCTLFEEKYIEALTNEDAISFQMNSARISANGRYYIMTAQISVPDPSSFFGTTIVAMPYLFDLQDGQYWPLSDGVSNVIATQVMDDGTVLGATKPDEYARQAVIARGADKSLEYLCEVIEKSDAKLYDWVKDNMEHNVVNVELVYDPMTDTYTENVTYETKIITGTPVATADLSMIASWTFNSWEDEGPEFYSYIMPMGGALSGIKAVDGISSVFGATLDRNGVLSISGNVIGVDIYDINGRMVYSTDAKGSVNTGLSRGMYIIKATGTDGNVRVSKAVSK